LLDDKENIFVGPLVLFLGFKKIYLNTITVVNSTNG